MTTSQETDLALPDPHALTELREATTTTHAEEVLDRVSRHAITDGASWSALEHVLREVVDPMIERIDQTFNRHIAAAHKAHKDLIAERNGLRAPWEQIEALAKSKFARFREEDERRRREEQRKRDAEERERQLAEAAAIEAAAVETADPLMKADAEAALDEAIHAPTPTPEVAPAIPKGTSIGSAGRWYADVESLGKLVAAVAQGRVPIHAIKPDLDFLNRQAAALRRPLEFYPGVRAYKRTHTRRR